MVYKADLKGMMAALEELTAEFGKVAGHEVNNDKTKVMAWNMPREGAPVKTEINITPRACLALRPPLSKLGIRFRLFEPSRMWITRDSSSRDFFNPGALRLFLDSLSDQAMDHTLPDPSSAYVL
ncbi:hypothetical protein NDU88_009217 [Pleurodeles waltl]|uniref:Uncharacterized protein n=1 Tax=Pleurodeles waltl TaxID=8319 RepID=A0AAV7PRG7_PLEWA|nr:hypothetical protein NDU88_009217 [Pleurodeles waltl]